MNTQKKMNTSNRNFTILYYIMKQLILLKKKKKHLDTIIHILEHEKKINHSILTIEAKLINTLLIILYNKMGIFLNNFFLGYVEVKDWHFKFFLDTKIGNVIIFTLHMKRGKTFFSFYRCIRIPRVSEVRILPERKS